MGVTEVMTTVIDGASTESRESGSNHYRDIAVLVATTLLYILVQNAYMQCTSD